MLGAEKGGRALAVMNCAGAAPRALMSPLKSEARSNTSAKNKKPQKGETGVSMT